MSGICSLALADYSRQDRGLKALCVETHSEVSKTVSAVQQPMWQQRSNPCFKKCSMKVMQSGTIFWGRINGGVSVGGLDLSKIIVRCSALLCLTTGSVFSAVGCTPSVKMPVSGHVNLQYSNKSESGLTFTLDNGLSEPIRFRGYKALTGDVTPDVYSVLCSSEATGIATAVGAGFKDGGSSPDRIKAIPGEQIHLVIPTEYFQRYKGQTCKLSLILENDSKITSQAFVP